MEQEQLRILIGIATLVGLIFGFAAWSKRKQTFARLAASLHTKDEGSIWTGTHEGTPYSYCLWQWDENMPLVFEVQIDCFSPCSFSVYMENTALDDMLAAICRKPFSLLRVTSGDALFDRNFECYSVRRRKFVTAFLQSPSNRATIREVARLHVWKLEHDGTKLRVSWRPVPPEKVDPQRHIDPAFVVAPVPLLAILAQQLEAIPASDPSTSSC